MLDCKKEGCRVVQDSAPLVLDHLGEASQAHFAGVQQALDRLEVPYRVNPRVVRGLDYYTRTVFEAVAEGLGSQNAICGGGRYDRLVEQLGGPSTPAVGYAQGLERLAMLLAERAVPESGAVRVALVPVSEAERPQAEQLAMQLRQAGLQCILDLAGRSVKAQFRRANRQQAHYAVVLGEAELASGEAQLKDLQGAADPQLVRLDRLAAELSGAPEHE